MLALKYRLMYKILSNNRLWTFLNISYLLHSWNNVGGPPICKVNQECPLMVKLTITSRR